MPWTKLTKTTTSTFSSLITTNPFQKLKLVNFLFHGLSNADQPKVRFGENTPDQGTNYAHRVSSNGGADSTNTSQRESKFYLSGATARDVFIYASVINILDREKLIIGHLVEQQAVGAGTAPSRGEGVSKWVNTTQQINIAQVEPNTGIFDVSNITILGTNTQTITHANGNTIAELQGETI